MTDHELRIRFNYSIDSRFSFRPETRIPLKGLIQMESVPESFLKNMVFNLGMIELISYWKATCSPTIVIHCGGLTEEQVKWWKNLYFHGLGEFFYLNSIVPDITSFVDIRATQNHPMDPVSFHCQEAAVIPVGGGKDSTVSLELWKRTGLRATPFILNPRGATLWSAEAAGYERESLLEAYRTIDPNLLKLNEQGFLNGHTPFSALLAFLSVMVAALSGNRFVVLSNESSANEPTVRNGPNHQYSKSYAFEKDFRHYLCEYLTDSIEYFSLLRPLSELQIARLFASFPQYHKLFRSCNAGSKTDSWCGKCPKCLFTWIMLSPFMEMSTLVDIFGHNLWEDHALESTLDQLTGKTSEKPFECVGTVDEVNMALAMSLKKASKPYPYLLSRYAGSDLFHRYAGAGEEDMLQVFHSAHFLPEEMEKNVRKAIQSL